MSNKRKIPFAGLHNHSEFSNIRMHDSISKIEDMAKAAIEFDYSGIVYTDHECLSSAVRIEELRDKYLTQGLKIGFGNEIYLTDEKEIEEIDKFYHFLLIARTKKGYEYLKRLSSLAWKRSKFKKGIRRVPTFYSDIEQIVTTQGDLIASTACLGSKYSELVCKYIEDNSLENKQKIVDFVDWCLKIFGKDYFYIELQSSTNEEQIEYNKMAYKIAKAFGIRTVLTEDTHYLYNKDKSIHKSYVESTRTSNEDDNAKDFYEGCYFKNEEDLRQRMNYFSDEEFYEMCTNTVNIINSIENYTIKQPTQIAERSVSNFKLSHIFQPWYDKYEYIKKFAYSEYEQDKFLLMLMEDGFKAKGLEFNDTYLSRINTELEVLWFISKRLNQRLSAYYSLVSYIMDLIWEEGDSIIGVGRGSACGMIVCYLLNITQLDPVVYNLPYWRHISQERIELPDVDFDSETAKRPQIIEMLKRHFGEERVLGVATFRTESSKSAILTACRGLNIPLEEAQTLADLIPIERGKAWSIRDCVEGDGEEKKPVTLFNKIINEYPNLLNTVYKIEGLISGCGSHASGMLIFPKSYLEQGSWMYTPNGIAINCFELHDAEKCGSLKFDLLSVENLDSIHQSLDLLLRNKIIEDKGSLRENYNAYLHPDILDYQTSKMFDLLASDNGVDVFQLSTDLARKSCKMLKPQSLKEMSLINSVMRLMGDGNTESPIEKYNRFKQDISQWYQEMDEAGLTKEEQNILEKYLLPSSGMAICQETVMLISMDEKISNFTMGESNTLRKSIAKKSASLVEKSKNLFYEKGRKIGTSENMLDYVWNVQISLSLGYSFSDLHCMVYSCIGLQQLNLLYHYPMIYSQCASLLVASSSNEGNEENNIDYGKVATSVCQSKNSGVNFKPISINKAQKGFIPNAQENIIIAGLKGISGVNNEFADKIIANRPYNDIDDFIEKTQPLKTQMLSLIKAGAFDEFNPNRTEVMIYYINRVITQENTYKDKLTGANLDKIKSMNILPEEYLIYIRYYNFNKYITDKQFVYKKEGRKTFLIAKDIGFTFFEQHYIQDLVEDRDYYYCKDGIVFDKSAYNKIYKARLEKLTTYINTSEFLEKYNAEFMSQKFYEIWDKYCQGTEKDWEFDSYNYYVGEHALANVNMQKYNFSAFKDLPEKPIIEEEYEYKGRTCYRYNLSRICGVVLDNDRTKHTITLLTNKNEVIKVKYYAGQFIAYNTPITEMVEGKKITRDKSWLTRGNLLVLVGYRNDDMFIPRTYARSIYRHSTALIEDYDTLGNLTIRELRYGEKEKTWKDK